MTAGTKSRPSDGDVKSVARVYGLGDVLLTRPGRLDGRVAERGGKAFFC
jgi:hypothetical protein